MFQFQLKYQHKSRIKNIQMNNWQWNYKQGQSRLATGRIEASALIQAINIMDQRDLKRSKQKSQHLSTLCGARRDLQNDTNIVSIRSVVFVIWQKEIMDRHDLELTFSDIPDQTWQYQSHGYFPIGPPLSPTSYLSPFSSYLTLTVDLSRSSEVIGDRLIR